MAAAEGAGRAPLRAALTVWLAPHMRTLSSGSEARNSFTFWQTKCFFLVLVLLALRAEPNAAPTPPADEPPAQFEAMADPDRRRHREPDRTPPPLPRAPPYQRLRMVPPGPAHAPPFPMVPPSPVSPCPLVRAGPLASPPSPLPQWFRPRLPLPPPSRPRGGSLHR